MFIGQSAGQVAGTVPPLLVASILASFSTPRRLLRRSSARSSALSEFSMGREEEIILIQCSDPIFGLGSRDAFGPL
jgi:hypothetical protein